MKITSLDMNTPKRWVEIDGMRINLAENLIRSKFNQRYVSGMEVLDYRQDTTGNCNYLVVVPVGHTTGQSNYQNPAPQKQPYVKNTYIPNKQPTSITTTNYSFYFSYIKDITNSLIQAGVITNADEAYNFYITKSLDNIAKIKELDTEEVE